MKIITANEVKPGEVFRRTTPEGHVPEKEWHVLDSKEDGGTAAGFAEYFKDKVCLCTVAGRRFWVRKESFVEIKPENYGS